MEKSPLDIVIQAIEMSLASIEKKARTQGKILRQLAGIRPGMLVHCHSANGETYVVGEVVEVVTSPGNTRVCLKEARIYTIYFQEPNKGLNANAIPKRIAYAVNPDKEGNAIPSAFMELSTKDGYFFHVDEEDMKQKIFKTLNDMGLKISEAQYQTVMEYLMQLEDHLLDNVSPKTKLPQIGTHLKNNLSDAVLPIDSVD